MDVAVRSPRAIDESNQQKALLAWATDRIDQLANQYGHAQQLGELLDWLACFTREHFGLQQRLLNECSRQREYLLDRIDVHCEFRRRLAQLCVDSIRRDPSVPERLRALCHDLLADAQAQQDKLLGIMDAAAGGPKLRRKARRGQSVTLAAELFRSPVSLSSDDKAAAH